MFYYKLLVEEPSGGFELFESNCLFRTKEDAYFDLLNRKDKLVYAIKKDAVDDNINYLVQYGITYQIH